MTRNPAFNSGGNDMALRWTAAGMLETEHQFRKIIGYRSQATSLAATLQTSRRPESGFTA
jgi:hypothetical protein